MFSSLLSCWDCSASRIHCRGCECAVEYTELHEDHSARKIAILGDAGVSLVPKNRYRASERCLDMINTGP